MSERRKTGYERKNDKAAEKLKEAGGMARAVLVVNNSGLSAGDEVIYEDMRALVCSVHMEQFVDILALNGMVFEGIPIFAVTKTGRHFGILREVLDIIGQTVPSDFA